MEKRIQSTLIEKRIQKAALERMGDTLTGFQGFNLKTKASIWPCLSCMCRIRLAEGVPNVRAFPAP
jgi:hypothetical protein